MLFPYSSSSLIALALLLPSCLCSSFDDVLELSKTLKPRTLRAAALRSDAARRSIEVNSHKDVLLHYVNQPTDANSPVAAHVSLSSTRHTLLLEEMDGLLEEVHCEANLLQLRTRPTSFSHLDVVLKRSSDYLVITSHATCNEHGSRQAYLIRDHQSHRSSNTITLKAAPVAWHQAYDVQVDFGADERDYIMNSHEHLRRRSLRGRQVTKTSTTTSTPSTAVASSASTLLTSQVVFPSNTTSVAPTKTASPNNIDKAFIDKHILPIDALSGFTIDGTGFPDDISLLCKECSVSGNVQLTSGSFKVANSNSSKFQNDTDLIESGYIAVTANNLFAHVELEAGWAPSVAEKLNTTLFSVPLTPFTIPGIANIGLQFIAELTFAAELDMNATFNAGFEVHVPNNSTLQAAIHVNESQVTGFEHTKFTTLGFSASEPDIEVKVEATLRASVLAGIFLFNGMGTAGVGGFLDLPKLDLSIKQVEGTDTDCNPTSDETILQDLADQYGPVINVVPEAVLAVGAVVQAKVNIPGYASLGNEQVVTPLATTFAVPTACLAYNTKKGTFESPTKTPTATATAKGAGKTSSASSSGGKTSAAGALVVPTGGLLLQMFVVGAGLVLGSLFLL